MAVNATTLLSNYAKYRQLSHTQRLAIIAYCLSLMVDNDNNTTYATNPATLLSDSAQATKGLNRDDGLLEAAWTGLVVVITSGGKLLNANNCTTAPTTLSTLLSSSAKLAGATEDQLQRAILFLVGKDLNPAL